MAAAVSDSDGTQQMFHRGMERDVGFSSSKAHAAAPMGRRHAVQDSSAPAVEAAAARAAVSVRTVDLAGWVRREVASRRVPPTWRPRARPPTVVMKLDVEGQEYAVLARLFETRAICSIDLITYEGMHGQEAKAVRARAAAAAAAGRRDARHELRLYNELAAWLFARTAAQEDKASRSFPRRLVEPRHLGGKVVTNLTAALLRRWAEGSDPACHTAILHGDDEQVFPGQ